MHRIWIVIVMSIWLGSGCIDKANEPGEHAGTSHEKFNVDQLMKDPSRYTGRKIKVEGIVTHVCRHGGKRLHLSTSGSDTKLRVRIGKDLKPFKRELEGSTIGILGTFSEERVHLKDLQKMKNSHAHEAHDESKDDEKSSSQNTNVSSAYIEQIEDRIKQSGKDYISEYWLTAKKINY